MIDLLDHRRQPLAIRRQPPVVLDNDIDSQRVGELGQRPQAIGGPTDLIFIAARRGGVDPDRMAAQVLRRLDPLVMVLDRLGPLGQAGVPQVPLAVDHDQQQLHPHIPRPLLQLIEVSGVARLVLEELIHKLHGMNAKLLFRHLGKIEVVELSSKNGPMQRPLGERDFKQGLVLGPGEVRRQPGGGEGPRSPEGRLGQEVTSRKQVGHGKVALNQREKPTQHSSDPTPCGPLTSAV